MIVVETGTEVREWRRSAQGTVGFVPTMGALHEGHRSLVRRAREECDRVVASVFVNPKQFAPNEDLDRYPRPREADESILREDGVDLAWFGRTDDFYPQGFATEVAVPLLARGLCGRTRPTHFAGVATVVLKLLHRVEPNRAYFGRKDFQQFVLIRRMVEDLDLDIEIVPCPIVRERDGLAMSSRNVHLSERGRQRALALWRGLTAAKHRFDEEGDRDATSLVLTATREILAETGVELEYVELVDARSLVPVEVIEGDAVLAVAARVDGVRLIDNIAFGADR
ncbi:MAG: pantoate--beta-alanine ligase [Planctomycetes bacterium]|nr:pantoate--beta-alanine ligase [Planctomycetota bacterium]